MGKIKNRIIFAFGYFLGRTDLSRSRQKVRVFLAVIVLINFGTQRFVAADLNRGLYLFSWHPYFFLSAIAFLKIEEGQIV
jgi:hypothetical protein